MSRFLSKFDPFSGKTGFFGALFFNWIFSWEVMAKIKLGQLEKLLEHQKIEKNPAWCGISYDRQERYVSMVEWEGQELLILANRAKTWLPLWGKYTAWAVFNTSREMPPRVASAGSVYRLMKKQYEGQEVQYSFSQAVRYCYQKSNRLLFFFLGFSCPFFPLII